MIERNAYDQYWRLHEHNDGTKSNLAEKLKTHGYEVDVRKVDRADLVKSLQRQERGLLFYEKCSNAELETFTTARKLVCYLDPKKSEKVSKLLRESTIETLMEADEERRFEKFMDLPPELRAQIYEHYNAGLPKTLILPTKPPLSRVCRQLRQEVLPIFYTTHEFAIELIRNRSGVPVFRETNETYIWLSLLASGDLENIDRLKIVVRDRYRRGSTSNPTGVVGRIYIRLNVDKDEWEFTAEGRKDDEFCESWDDKRLDRLNVELRKVMEKVELVGEKGRFKVEDIHKMRRAVSAAYE